MIRHLAVAGLAAVALGCDNFAGEVDGTVKYEDCREQIQIARDSPRILMKRFTCDTQRTRSGRVMSATCVHVETTNDGACQRAYIYRKPPALTCSEDKPFLDPNEECYAQWEPWRVNASGATRNP